VPALHDAIFGPSAMLIMLGKIGVSGVKVKIPIAGSRKFTTRTMSIIASSDWPGPRILAPL
jgi:hypothetical protein